MAAGAAYTALAELLADSGHRVSVLFTPGAHSQRQPFEHWVAHYAAKQIALEPLQPSPELGFLPPHLAQARRRCRLAPTRCMFSAGCEFSRYSREIALLGAEKLQNAWQAHAVYRRLRDTAFDVVHFHEYGGAGAPQSRIQMHVGSSCLAAV